jgi:hypothetical protein
MMNGIKEAETRYIASVRDLRMVGWVDERKPNNQHP